MSKSVTILYFAWLRERVGSAREEIQLPDHVETVAGLVDHLAAGSPRHAEAFRNRGTVRSAINQEFSGPNNQVHPGDEVAFFPPVTGG